jgi:hypothetical protein
MAPLKIHISSLPRKREPSQINKLDSRFRGNDEFLEVSLSYFARLGFAFAAEVLKATAAQMSILNAPASTSSP